MFSKIKKKFTRGKGSMKITTPIEPNLVDKKSRAREDGVDGNHKLNSSTAIEIPDNQINTNGKKTTTTSSLGSSTISHSSTASSSDPSFHSAHTCLDDDYKIKEMLEGRINLKINIKHLNEEVIFPVDREMPLYDILVTMANKYRFNPAHYTITANEGSKRNQILFLKSNPVGLIDAKNVSIVPKPTNSVNKDGRSTALPFERTVRFKANLPKNQLLVKRIPITKPFQEIKEMIFKEKSFDFDQYLLVLPFKQGQSPMIVELDKTPEYYDVKEVTVLSVKNYEQLIKQFTANNHYRSSLYMDDSGSNRLNVQNDWSQSTPNISMKQPDTCSLASSRVSHRSHKKKPAPPPPPSARSSLMNGAKSFQNLGVIRDENEDASVSNTYCPTTTSSEKSNHDVMIKQPSSKDGSTADRRTSRLHRQNSGSDSSGYHEGLLSNTEADTPTDSNSPVPVSPNPPSDLDVASLVTSTQSKLVNQHLPKLSPKSASVSSSSSFKSASAKKRRAPPPPRYSQSLDSRVGSPCTETSEELPTSLCCSETSDAVSSVDEQLSMPNSSPVIPIPDVTKTENVKNHFQNPSTGGDIEEKFENPVQIKNKVEVQDELLPAIENNSSEAHVAVSAAEIEQPIFESNKLEFSSEINVTSDDNIVKTELSEFIQEQDSMPSNPNEQERKEKELDNGTVEESEHTLIEQQVKKKKSRWLALLDDFGSDHSDDNSENSQCHHSEKKDGLPCQDCLNFIENFNKARNLFKTVESNHYITNSSGQSEEKQVPEIQPSAKIEDLEFEVEKVHTQQPQADLNHIDSPHISNQTIVGGSANAVIKIDNEAISSDFSENTVQNHIDEEMVGKSGLGTATAGFVQISEWGKRSDPATKTINKTDTIGDRLNNDIEKKRLEKQVEITLNEFDETLDRCTNNVNIEDCPNTKSPVPCTNVLTEQKNSSINIEAHHQNSDLRRQSGHHQSTSALNKSSSLSIARTKVMINSMADEHITKSNLLSSSSFTVRDGIRRFNTINEKNVSQQNLSSLRDSNNTIINVNHNMLRRSTSKLSSTDLGEDIAAPKVSRKLANFQIGSFKSESSIDIYQNQPQIDINRINSNEKTSHRSTIKINSNDKDDVEPKIVKNNANINVAFSQKSPSSSLISKDAIFLQELKTKSKTWGYRNGTQLNTINSVDEVQQQKEIEKTEPVGSPPPPPPPEKSSHSALYKRTTQVYKLEDDSNLTPSVNSTKLIPPPPPPPPPLYQVSNRIVQSSKTLLTPRGWNQSNGNRQSVHSPLRSISVDNNPNQVDQRDALLNEIKNFQINSKLRKVSLNKPFSLQLN